MISLQSALVIEQDAAPAHLDALDEDLIYLALSSVQAA